MPAETTTRAAIQRRLNSACVNGPFQSRGFSVHTYLFLRASQVRNQRSNQKSSCTRYISQLLSGKLLVQWVFIAKGEGIL